MSWKATKLFYLGIVVVGLGIAVGFVALGFWPILPFAGAELLALGAAFYVCARDGERAQFVRIDDQKVAVEKGRLEREQSWEFIRAWTRVRLSRSRVMWHPSRLLLGSHGREVEVGEFLNEDERRELAGALRQAIGGN